MTHQYRIIIYWWLVSLPVRCALAYGQETFLTSWSFLRPKTYEYLELPKILNIDLHYLFVTVDTNITMMRSYRRNTVIHLVLLVTLQLGDVAFQLVTAAAEVGVLKELHEQFEKSIQVLLGTDTRLIRVDATTHTANKQTEFCPSALPIAMNAILNYANPDSTKPLYDATSKYDTKKLEIMVLASAMEICTICITNNPKNRNIFSDGQNLQQSHTIHSSVVAMLRVPELTAKAGHLIWIGTYANAKNHFQFVAADAIDALSAVILNVPYPIPTTERNGAAISVMWAAAALQNLAASYCDAEGTCAWEWFKHENHDEQHLEFEYVFELTEDSGNLMVDATLVRQAILANSALIHRLLQWSCHGPVSGAMSMENPFPGENALAIPEHESSMNVVPWAAMGALANVAIDNSAKTQLLDYYGDTMPCFCYMSISPDWLEAAKGYYAIQNLRHDKDPCWFDVHEKGEDAEHEHVLCVDRRFTDISGASCYDYSDPSTLNEEDCATPDIANESFLADAACCLCSGGDHYPKSSPINIHEPDEEAIRALNEAQEERAEVSEHEEDLPYDGEEDSEALDNDNAESDEEEPDL